MRRSVIFLLVVIACSLLTAGCGSSDSPTTSQPLTSTTTEAGAPQYGGTLRVVVASLVGDFGYPVTVTGQALEDTQACFETPLRGDADGNLHPPGRPNPMKLPTTWGPSLSICAME
jgi:hypothetical protein